MTPSVRGRGALDFVTLSPMLRIVRHARKSGSVFTWLVLSSSATAGIIIAGKHGSPWLFGALLIVAAAAFFLLLRAESRRPSLRCATVFGVSALLMIIAVVLPPRTSNDVWAYAIYGRIVTEYHASPYVHVPESYPNDPYFPRAQRGYHDVKSVYGPAFTAVSAGVMQAAGDQKTIARVLFQSIAALSVLGALALLWRKTKDAAVLAFAGLNPIMAASVVNGGHNDAVLGLTVLGGAYAAPAHPVIAGLILGLGASIKIVALLPFGAVALWALYRKGRRAAAGLIASGLGILLGGYALAGGLTAFRPLSRGEGLTVRHSIWFYPRQWFASSLEATGLTRARAVTSAGHRVGLIGIAFVIAVALIILFAHYRRHRPEHLAGGSLTPYLLGAPYTLPWYPAWVLPALAPSRKGILARIAALDAVLLFAVDPDRFTGVHGWAGAVVHAFGRYVLPILEGTMLIALVWLGVRELLKRRRNRKVAGATPPTVEEEISRAAPA